MILIFFFAILIWVYLNREPTPKGNVFEDSRNMVAAIEAERKEQDRLYWLNIHQNAKPKPVELIVVELIVPQVQPDHDELIKELKDSINEVWGIVIQEAIIDLEAGRITESEYEERLNRYLEKIKR